MFCYLCERWLISVPMVRAFADGEFRNFCPACWEIVKSDKLSESYGKEGGG